MGRQERRRGRQGPYGCGPRRALLRRAGVAWDRLRGNCLGGDNLRYGADWRGDFPRSSGGRAEAVSLQRGNDAGPQTCDSGLLISSSEGELGRRMVTFRWMSTQAFLMTSQCLRNVGSERVPGAEPAYLEDRAPAQQGRAFDRLAAEHGARG